MEPQTKTSAKDFFINLGAIVTLYGLVVSLLNLLFSVINTAFPQVNNYYGYFTGSISWPVAVLIVFFPIFIVLMWVLEKEFRVNPEKQNSGIHKFFTYLNLFIAGTVIACDLITVLYYFIDGQELATGFLLKVLSILVVLGGLFLYYLDDARLRLTGSRRKIYRIIAAAIVIGSLILGFSVLGSPRTQRLYKYDEQKVTDLGNINSEIQNFYATKGVLPASLEDLSANNYYITDTDSQTNTKYQYEKTGKLTYNLCAEFNKASPEASKPNIYPRPIGSTSWTHPQGHYCFQETINPNMYSKPVPF